MYVKASMGSERASKKCVRWSTVTVYEFDVAIGGSAIPRHGGPSIGLAKTPKCVWSTPLDAPSDWEEMVEERDRSIEDSQIHLPDDDDRKAQAMVKARERQKRRRRTRVRWLKPFERVTMLTQAGLSERRIYRMMKECAAICMSRRLSIQSH